MTQSAMRIHANSAMPSAKKASAPTSTKATIGMQSKAKAKPKASTAKQAPAQQKHAQQGGQRPAETPSDVIANAAAETKRDRGVYASMKRAVSPYVENHSHAVLYGILGFIAAALILIVGFWPTVLLALFAAIGVLIGRYRDGDRAIRMQMKRLLDRFN